MIYSREQVIILLAILPNLIAALLAALKWRWLPTALRPLAILTLFALATELFCRVLWLLKVSNLFVWPIYISVEFGLLVWLYGRTFASRLLCRLRWPLVIGLALLANLEGLLRLAQPFVIDNAGRLLESIIIILLALAYYHHTLRQPGTAYIWHEPMFWVSTGLLFSFAGNFLIYTFINFAYYYHRPLVIQIWLVHAALNSLLYCTYAYALWLSPKK